MDVIDVMKNCGNSILFFLNFHRGREKTLHLNCIQLPIRLMQPFCKMGSSEPELQGGTEGEQKQKTHTNTQRRKGKREVTLREPHRPSLTRREHRRCSQQLRSAEPKPGHCAIDVA
jgi:hypothetical protein